MRADPDPLPDVQRGGLPGLASLALAALVLACDPAAARAFTLRLQAVATTGGPIDARMQVTRIGGSDVPAGPDSVTWAHRAGETVYGYPDAAHPLSVPAGVYRVRASHGPEWRPAEQVVAVVRDTTVLVPLVRADDLRPRGWYSGDLHVHTVHPPVDYAVGDAEAVRLARAEGLAVLQLLDQSRGFAGTVSPLSDSLVVMYHSYEYRNQAGGHASLAGLVSPVGEGCCWESAPAWPMLHDLRGSLSAQGALLVLAHPRTTSEYAPRFDWPGAGLGREMALLGALGDLDAMDVVSYSNEPDTDWDDWYDLLSSGLDVPASAGTDAVLGRYEHLPAGGWRVYARLGDGEALTYAGWLAALTAGRSFVTSGPLLPGFEVGGVGPGGTIDVPSHVLERPVHFEAVCATGLRRLELVADGEVAWSLDAGGRARIDTTFGLRMPAPRWLALRAEGMPGQPSLLGLPAVAHTSAVRVTADGRRRPLPAACARLWDAVRRYEEFFRAEGRLEDAQLDSLSARAGRAREYYGRAFVRPPGPFRLLPADPARPTAVRWAAAQDGESADRVRYEVQLDEDPAFPHPRVIAADDTVANLPRLEDSEPLWWRVFALDRGGNRTLAVNAPERLDVASLAGVPAGGAGPRPRAYPNPARSSVRLEGFRDDVCVLDVSGRRVAAPGAGLAPEGAAWVWRPRDGVPAARPGLYFATGADRRTTLRLVVLP